MIEFKGRKKIHKKFLLDGKDVCKEIHKRVLAEDSTRCSYCMETRLFDVKEFIANNIPKEEWSGIGPIPDEGRVWFGYKDRFSDGVEDKHIKHLWKQDLICCTTCGCFWYTRPYPLMVKNEKDYKQVIHNLFDDTQV